MCWVLPSGRTSTSPPVRLKDICHVCEGWETTFCLQIFPPLETDQANKRPLTRLQERLIKKLGGKWTLCVVNLHAFRKTSKADRTICTLRTKHHVLVAFALSLTDNYDAKACLSLWTFLHSYANYELGNELLPQLPIIKDDSQMIVAWSRVTSFKAFYASSHCSQIVYYTH